MVFVVDAFVVVEVAVPCFMLMLLLHANVLLKVFIFTFFNDPRPYCVDVIILRQIM